MTLPGWTSIEMSLIAITLPKYFESFLVSISASPFVLIRLAAFLRTKLLKITAASSTAPMKTWYQSPSIPVITIPCCTIAKISAPSAAPTAEP